LLFRQHHRHFRDHVLLPADDFAFAEFDENVARIDAELFGGFIRVQQKARTFLNGKFHYLGSEYYGLIHISELTGQYIRDINSFASVGDELKARILGYNDKYSKWELSCRMLS
jgi:predicted RNA-binding protein with RPS1 domain